MNDRSQNQAKPLAELAQPLRKRPLGHTYTKRYRHRYFRLFEDQVIVTLWYRYPLVTADERLLPIPTFSFLLTGSVRKKKLL